MPSQPKGLYVLFITELWERYGFYTTLFVIVLYAKEQLGMTDVEASLLFGTYTAFIYATTVPGGLLADRVMGFKWALLTGATLMASGCFLIVQGTASVLYAGLAFLLVGNGFFKPSMSSLLGLLYSPDDPRRDSGYTLFYIGTNIGAGAAALGSGIIVQNYGYGAAFLVAGISNCLSIASLLIGGILLKDKDFLPPANRLMQASNVGIPNIAWLGLGITGTIILANVLLHHSYATGNFLTVICVIFLAYFLHEVLTLDSNSRRDAYVMLILFCFGVAFWAVYNQEGDTVLLFLDRLVDRDILGHNVPPSSFLSLNEVFIICGAPFMSWFWNRLASNQITPSDARKFSAGLFLIGAAYLTLALAKPPVGSNGLIAPIWIIAFFFLFSFGELCVEPIGLSMVSRLVPKELLGFGMGMWFLVHSLGNYFSGLLAELAAIPAGSTLEEQRTINQGAFQDYGLLAVGAGLLLLALAPFLARQNLRS